VRFASRGHEEGRHILGQPSSDQHRRANKKQRSDIKVGGKTMLGGVGGVVSSETDTVFPRVVAGSERHVLKAGREWSDTYGTSLRSISNVTRKRLSRLFAIKAHRAGRKGESGAGGAISIASNMGGKKCFQVQTRIHTSKDSEWYSINPVMG